jgi:hypothetical protein
MSVRPVVLAIGVLAQCLPLAAQVRVPAGEAFHHDIRPGPGVTAVKKLSDYLPSLAGTPGDSDVYVMQGAKPGVTVFVAGGTHGNEISGIMAATVLVEHARVRAGRLIVVPHANNSAVTWTDPKRPGPEWIAIDSPAGRRRFKFGARLTRPDHQGAPDPQEYVHPGATQKLDGTEARNLDRAYPGRADGTLTERMAFAIVQVLRTEDARLAFDLHEAPPDSQLAWTIVAHPKGIDAAALAILQLEEDGVEMKLERSPEAFRGLSHREWGDATRARSYLFETPSPSMVAGGKDVDAVDDPTLPLARRVAVHLKCLTAVIDASLQDAPPSGRFQVDDLPRIDEMTRKGLGAYLASGRDGSSSGPIGVE